MKNLIPVYSLPDSLADKFVSILNINLYKYNAAVFVSLGVAGFCFLVGAAGYFFSKMDLSASLVCIIIPLIVCGFTALYFYSGVKQIKKDLIERKIHEITGIPQSVSVYSGKALISRVKLENITITIPGRIQENKILKLKIALYSKIVIELKY